MKCLVIISLFFVSLPTLAVRDERQLLKCLGEEEKVFHLNKDTGPLYDLNQRMIAEMVQIPKAELEVSYFQQMCSKGSGSAALKLLELSLRKGKEIFQVPSEVHGSQRNIAQSMIDEYLEQTKEIFLSFISQIQSLAPTATCLKEEIPEIEAFFTDIKYLQEDVDMKKIFEGRDIKIFQKLVGYPQAFDRCRARIKKKPSSASKVSPKKS